MDDNEQRPRAAITGGSSGIGLATAKILVQKGVDVVLIADVFPDLDPESESLLAGAERYTFDLRNTEGIEDLTKTIGPVDFLVNGAAIYHGKRGEDYSQAELADIQAVNVEAASKCITHFFHRGRLKRVVNVASLAAHTQGIDGPYAESKRQLLELTHKVAKQLGLMQIPVNAISPGVVEDTPLFDRIPEEALRIFREKTITGSFLKPEEVAICIVLLLQFPERITGQEFRLGT